MTSSPHSLHEWASRWLARQPAAGLEPPEPLTVAESPDESTGSAHTVGTGFSVAEMFLEQFEAVVAADEGDTGVGSHLVSADGGALPQGEILPGEIRRLLPGANARWDRPVFVLVTEVQAKQVKLVPFGPVEICAMQTELETGLGDAALRVLCLWNAVAVPLERARRSVLVEKAPAGLLQEVVDLSRHLASGSGTPSHLRSRTGPPLIHPHDPRHLYMEAERSLVESLIALS